MKRYYRIADSYLSLDCDERYIPAEFDDFQVDEAEVCEDNVMTVTGIKGNIPFALGQRIVENETVTILDNKDSYLILLKQITSVYGIYILKNEDKAEIYYTDNEVYDKVNQMYALKEVYFYFLQKKGKIVVHSASIIFSGKAWLFSAVSGTGKSTHVNMWREAGIDFEDFNGDTCACYIDDNGQAVAASMPWCGTSGIYCNKVVPLGGVMFLKRAEYNSADYINKRDGIINLAARSFSPNWNKELMHKTVDIAKNVGNKVVLGEVSCLPNEDAAISVNTFICNLK